MDFSQPILKVNTPYYKIEISTYSPIKLKCYNDSTVKIDINPKSSHNNKRNKYSCVPAITEASISPEFDKVHKHKHHNHHKHSSDYHYKKDYYTYNDDLEVTPETPTFTSQYSRYSNPIYQETQNIYAPQHESYDYMQEVQNLYSRPNVPPSYPYYYSPMKTYSKSNIISNISQPSYNYGSISNNINVNDYNDDSDSDYNNDNNYTPSYIPSKYMVSPGLSNSPRIEEYNNNELLEDKDDYSIKNEDLEEKEVEELVKNQEEQYHVEDEMIQDINQNQEDNSLESSSEAEYNTINFLMNKCKIYDGDDYISYIMREWKFNGSDYLRMHHEYLMVFNIYKFYCYLISLVYFPHRLFR